MALLNFVEAQLFRFRGLIIGLFLTITLLMVWSATGLKIDAGFSKLLPMQHPYMQTFVQYRQEFGGANRVVIALTVKEGDIFTPPFFDALKAITDEVFFIPGVDRTQVRSLFTPNVRFTEVVEDGIAGGNVVPDDFHNRPDDLERVRQNILKAGILGRLVANDFSGAIVSAQLLEEEPQSGRRVDFIEVSHALEQRVRDKYQSEQLGVDIDIHMIGFAKVVGDIADGAARVVLFFAVALLITALLVYLYARSLRLTLALLFCSLVAVIWQLGLLNLLGFGIDPMSILVPFLVFAIGVSHGVQMVSAIRTELAAGSEALAAARAGFRRLLIPGGIALLSDTIGFLVIYIIEIEIIREMAITAGLGVAVIILTNLLLLPLLLSYITPTEKYRRRLAERRGEMGALWQKLARLAESKAARITLLIALPLALWGGWQAADIKIGDLHRGVPELRADSRYNLDTEVISERFSIGVDLLSVIVEVPPEGCIDYAVMAAIDRFAWFMEGIEGVQSVITLSKVAKVINAGWNEGSLKWRVLPRDSSMLAQSVSPVPTSSGLLNRDCSVMPVHIFTQDHKAETIERIVGAVKQYRQQNPQDGVRFRLATGNVGVMAASNEEVEAAQFPILIYVFAVIILLCLITFRSWRATLCIVLPLGLVSLLAYALMTLLQIGLKVNTLPVVALGVGIGVDYGIYIYSRLRELLNRGLSLSEAYLQTLQSTGNGVLFTGITLAIGVATWIFSPLKFQADMGVLLTFMFLVNMLAAITLLPALARVLVGSRR